VKSFLLKDPPFWLPIFFDKWWPQVYIFSATPAILYIVSSIYYNDTSPEEGGGIKQTLMSGTISGFVIYFISFPIIFTIFEIGLIPFVNDDLYWGMVLLFILVFNTMFLTVPFGIISGIIIEYYHFDR
jgi:hypothetical protein